MAVTKQDLIDSANQIISESEKGGNTASRVGGLFLAFINFIAAIEGKVVDIPEYDDSEVRKAIENLKDAVDSLNQIVSDTKDLAASERERLQQLLDTLDSTINSNVNDMFNSAAWLEQFAKVIKQTVNEGEIAYQSGWDANIEAYLQQAGVWARDGDTTKTQWSTFKQSVDEISTQVAAVTEDLNGKVTKTQWSEISQKVDGIESSVNALINQGDVSVALKTAINQYVKDGIAGMNLESTYAKKDSENSKEVLEWMYSAFKNASSQDLSFAQMVAAGKDATTSGISEIAATSKMVKNGDVLERVNDAKMETMVGNAISGLYSKAKEDSATVDLFTQVKKTAGEVTTLNTAGVVTKSDLDSATAALFANSASETGNVLHEATAGLAAESYVDKEVKDAKTGLEQSISEASAALTATLNKNKSETDDAIAGVKVSVEEVSDGLNTERQARVDALAQVDKNMAGMLAEADLKGAMTTIIAQSGDVAASIVNKVNEKGSTITLSADKIEMTNAFANSITTNKAFVGYLEGGNATFSGHIIAQSLTLGDDVSIKQSNISELETTLGNIDTKFDKYVTISTLDDMNYATTEYVDGRISTNNVSDELDKALKGQGYIKASDVSVTTEKTLEGYKIETIKVGDNTTFTTITEPGDNFILTNVGKGTDTASSEGYFMVSTKGLLKARNAIIYGTVYANAGYFSGELKAATGSFTGAVTATSLTLGNNVSISQSNVKNLSSDLGSISTSINTINGSINTINNDLSNYAKTADVDSAVKTALAGKNYLTADSITVTTDSSGNLTKKTVKIGEDKSFTTITDGNFVLTNVGIGSGEKDSSVDYFKVDTNGLLEAHNAIIYGTIYANAGRFSGEITASSGTIGGFEISSGLLHSASGSTGITGGESYYYKDGSPLAFWAGGEYPTETWKDGKGPTSYTDDLWMHIQTTKIDGTVVYSVPVAIGRANYAAMSYSYGFSSSQTTAPSSWKTISWDYALLNGTTSGYVWIKAVNSYTSTTYLTCTGIDGTKTKNIQVQWGVSGEIWIENAPQTVSNNYWVRFRVNKGSSTAPDYTYTTPVLIGDFDNGVSYRYAIQDSSITTAPTSGWSSSSSAAGTVVLGSAYKTQGYSLWIEVTSGTSYYIRVDGDASTNYSIGIQTIDSDCNGPTFAVTQGGSLYATEGKIGGFTITNSTLSVGGLVGLSSNVPYSYSTCLWAGSATPSSAPFRVHRDGSLYATQGEIGGLEITNSGSLSYTEANLFGLKCTFATSGTTYTMSNTQSYIGVYSGSSITTVTLPTNPLAGSFVIVHNQRTTAITISNSTNFVGESYKSFSLGAGRCFVGVFLRAYGTVSPLINTTCWKISS